MPAPTLTPALAGNTPATVAATTTTLPPAFSPWPNLPVLRSDEARVNPTPADSEIAAVDSDPTHRPAPKTPK